MCDCIRITYKETTGVNVTIEITPIGTYNGKPYYEWTDPTSGNTYYLYYYPAQGNWISTLGGFPFPTYPSAADSKIVSPCPPIGSSPAIWNANSLDYFEVSDCLNPPEIGDCQCGIEITFSNQSTGIPATTVVAQTSGIYGNRLQFIFYVNGLAHFIRWNGLGYWEIVTGPNGIIVIATLSFDILCPIGTLDDWTAVLSGWENYTSAADCKTCGIEDRTKRSLQSIKLPSPFIEEDRGDKGCCCKYMILASNSGDSFENDVTSAWIKISDPTDTVFFELWKNGADTGIVFDLNSFPNEDNAIWITINWSEVLTKYGQGCYELRVRYEIAGVNGSYIYGTYNLMQYSIENALQTARIKVVFNGVHETSGLDFTGTNIVDTFRFYGYIGNRQPNTEIDNIIYGNREMKRVQRENLNTYEIITDPSTECIIKPLIDLYLLSENELYISDYNAHNHSYRYIDVPVIVSDSPEIEYYKLSRKAQLTCEVSDKFKRNRTYF